MQKADKHLSSGLPGDAETSKERTEVALAQAEALKLPASLEDLIIFR
ncbi:MAG: hypothetical protein NTY37_13155 [Methanothrix sp.]|nr:hypothetical protein [Methanothrix sp.]